MKRLMIVTIAVACLGFSAWQIMAQPPVDTRPDRLKPFMQRKLDFSKSILEGLAVENFDMIRKNAEELKLLSMQSNWEVMTTEEYLELSSDFRRATKVISEAAEEKNVDRAALGFVDLTVRCVECHKYLRKRGINLPALKSSTQGQ